MKPKPLNRVLKPKPLRQSYGYDVLRTFALSSTFVRIDEVLSAVEGLKQENIEKLLMPILKKVQDGELTAYQAYMKIIDVLNYLLYKWFPVAKKGAE